MELYEYLKIFKAYKRLIFSIILVGVLLAFSISAYRAQQYEASFFLVIRPKVIEKTENFQLTDIFEASDRVTRMTENWLREQRLDIKTKRLGNQLIKISHLESKEDVAQKQMQGITKKSNEFLSSLSPTNGLGSFEALSADFLFQKRSPYWTLSLSAGIIIGLFAGLFFALFSHYLEKR
ncbi:MAG: hypothetical protein HY001_00180 [Candidatus Portnoybacteria bacterium]|nr:hypothetical protein [Candidatus Portnoybacteria bacterium]